MGEQRRCTVGGIATVEFWILDFEINRSQALTQYFDHMTSPSSDLSWLLGGLWDEAWMANIQIIYVYVAIRYSYPNM
jgi:hypothetical protein